LNPADVTYLNEFRIHEGVDTSYTKFQRKPDPIDDNPFNKVVPPAELLYVGWTEPGEWFNVTVDVTDAGTYATDFLYTSNRGGTISVDVNGKDATGPVQIASTNDPADRWPGANGITGIWLRSFSTFDSAKGRMSLPFTS
jgi:hypothetical protein